MCGDSSASIWPATSRSDNDVSAGADSTWMPAGGFTAMRSLRPGCSTPPSTHRCHAVVVLQEGALPDGHRHVVLGAPDAPALEVFGALDAVRRIDVDRRVAKRARGVDGNGDEAPVATREHGEVVGAGHFGDVELVVLELPPERLRRNDGHVVQVDAFRPDLSRRERGGAVVEPAGIGQMERSARQQAHSFTGLPSSRSVEARRSRATNCSTWGNGLSLGQPSPGVATEWKSWRKGSFGIGGANLSGF